MKAAPPIDAEMLLAWYDRHARDLPWRIGPGKRAQRVAPDPYRVWLSEVMLQQTTVATVKAYFERFVALWPSIADLAAAPLEAVLVEWAGLGYYARARNLHTCARAVVERHGGVFPGTSAELQTLPGVGPYTAAAVAAIAFDERVAVVDGNVERVMARFLALDRPPREAKDDIRAKLERAVPARAGDFAQAMMDLGATICAPKAALCMLCPLHENCRAAAMGSPLAFPVKAEKAARPVRYGHAFVIYDADGDVFLRKRAAAGLLAQMTETPTSPWQAESVEPEFPFAAAWRRHGRIVHVFTHFRLELDVWSAKAADPSALADGWWASPQELDAEALPTLFRKVLAAALESERRPEERDRFPPSRE
jgi:A/G-specific adenine glycosylase